jgi:hypothetical protein
MAFDPAGRDRFECLHARRCSQDDLAALCPGTDSSRPAGEVGMTSGAVYIAKSRVLRRLHGEFAELL